jgi:phosphate starvation-inducible protein PhoH
VASVVKSIKDFVAAIPEDGNVPTVTEAYDYPSEFSGHLIGAGGSNINKLRETYGVEINLKEGKGEIKGIKVAVDAAKRKLDSQIKEVQDKATKTLKIPQQFHATIIGSGGETVKRLETRHDVRIMFPKSSRRETGSDADEGGPSNKQGLDEVVIKGNKAGVAAASEEIQALYKYEEDKSHVATIPVAAKAIEFMFKNAAKEIRQLREDTQARIDIPQRSEAGSDETLTIKIRGTQEEVKNAKAVLLKIVKEAEQTTVRTITVDKKYHRSLIGSGGKFRRILQLVRKLTVLRTNIEGTRCWRRWSR